jgi:phage/plasmid-like protein (TIGR03299 family)
MIRRRMPGAGSTYRGGSSVSRETLEWLNTNVLVGYADRRGNAWHFEPDAQGGEPNHYDGPVPVDDVRRRLFDWKPVESPIYVDYDGGLPKAQGFKAVLRSDTGLVMGIFKDGYTAHPYDEWLVENVEGLLNDGLSVGSAGLLKGGAVAWVSVEVPENIKTPSGVVFRPHLLACTSFDGSLATTYKRVVTNVVCDNTMSAALAEKGQQYKVKHSKYSKLRKGEAVEALAMVTEIAEVFERQVEVLTNVPVNRMDWAKFLDAYAPMPEEAKGAKVTNARNRRGDLEKLWYYDTRVAPWNGTAYGVLQAVNTYEHWTMSVKGDRFERNQLRAVEGKWDEADTTTLKHLGSALNRDLLALVA